MPSEPKSLYHQSDRMQFFTEFSSKIAEHVRQERERLEIAINAPESDLAQWYWKSRFKGLVKWIAVITIISIVLYTGYQSRSRLAHERWRKREHERRLALEQRCMDELQQTEYCGNAIMLDGEPGVIDIYCDRQGGDSYHRLRLDLPGELARNTTQITVKEHFLRTCPQLQPVIVKRFAQLSVHMEEMDEDIAVFIPDPNTAVCMQHVYQYTRPDFSCLNLERYQVHPPQPSRDL